MNETSARDTAIPPEESDPLRCFTRDLNDEYEIANADVPATPPYSGDFHDAFSLEDGRVAVVLGDVVGHGEEAHVHAGVLCRAIGDCLREGLPPSEALAFVNAAAEMSPEFEGFATVFAGTVEPGTGTLTYASGGHEPAMVAGPPTSNPPSGVSSSPNIHELGTTGPPLGVVGADEVSYSERTAFIPGGGSLLLYTDGITEARRHRTIMGFERLRRVFARRLRLRPLRLVTKIIGLARAFTGRGRKLRDDAALMILRRRRWPRQRSRAGS